VPPVDVRGSGESVGVGLVACEVAAGENLPVNGRACRSQRGRGSGPGCQPLWVEGEQVRKGFYLFSFFRKC
jgi:hypothetical protein